MPRCLCFILSCTSQSTWSQTSKLKDIKVLKRCLGSILEQGGYTLPDLRYTYKRKTHTRQTFLEIGERPDSNIHSWSICQWADKPLCIDGKGSFQVRVSYFPILSNIAYQRTDYVSNPIYLSIQISIIHLYSYQAFYLPTSIYPAFYLSWLLHLLSLVGFFRQLPS